MGMIKMVSFLYRCIKESQTNPFTYVKYIFFNKLSVVTYAETMDNFPLPQGPKVTSPGRRNFFLSA